MWIPAGTLDCRGKPSRFSRLGEYRRGALGLPSVAGAGRVVRGNCVLQLDQLGETRIRVIEEDAPGGGCERPAIVEMHDSRTAAAQLDGEFPPFEGFTVCMRERAYLHSEGLMRRRADIEIAGELAVGAARKHIVPPAIVFRGGHVVRHEVEQDAEMLGASRCDETLPGGLAAEIRANATRIGHVVAMHAARVCLQARGEVYVTHAELGEVGKNPLRILQREARMQLQAG